MKIKRKLVADNILYQLDGWENDDWMDALDFLNELIESEADYQVVPNVKLKQGKAE